MPTRCAAPLIRRTYLTIVFAAAAGAVGPTVTHAQTAADQPECTGSASFTSAFLPATHWAVDAARRVAAISVGRDSAYGWGDFSLTEREAAVTLRAAAARDESDRFAAVTKGYWDRFRDEFPATVALLEGGPCGGAVATGRALGQLTASVGGDGRYHVVIASSAAPGTTDRTLTAGRATTWTPGGLGPAARAAWSMTPLAPLAIALAPAYSGGSWRSSEGYGLLGVGPFGVWAGRRAMRFGPGAGGGLIMNGTVPLNALGASSISTIRFPSVLGLIGPVSGEAFLAEVDSSASVRHPYLASAHIAVAPHPRLLLGTTYGALFAGEGVGALSFGNVWCMLFVGHAYHCTGSDYEYQNASVEARFRPPVPAPVTLYLEWGIKDNSRAWRVVPTVLAGFSLDAVPGLPALSVGAEEMFFHPPCGCSFYATWYQHYTFRGGWTIDGIPLGHPLGGTGYETTLYGRWDDPQHRGEIKARAFVRTRGLTNLLAPIHQGRSVGTVLSVDRRISQYTRFTGSVEVEHGRDWDQARSFLGMTFLPGGVLR